MQLGRPMDSPQKNAAAGGTAASLIRSGEVSTVTKWPLTSASHGDLEKSLPWNFSSRKLNNVVLRFRHFQPLACLKMAGHPWPARAP